MRGKNSSITIDYIMWQREKWQNLGVHCHRSYASNSQQLDTSILGRLAHNQFSTDFFSGSVKEVEFTELLLEHRFFHSHSNVDFVLFLADERFHVAEWVANFLAAGLLHKGSQLRFNMTVKLVTEYSVKILLRFIKCHRSLYYLSACYCRQIYLLQIPFACAL